MSQAVPAPGHPESTASEPSRRLVGSAERGEAPVGQAPVILQRGASFEGWLSCRQSARIEGRFKGNVVAEGRIELGESCEVSGRIEAEDIVVAGDFEGELLARQSIELLATARVRGELHARELSAEEGCTVTGRCRTGSAPKASS